jgi:DNA repair exonuclease SbcCD ATPase subunit
MITRIELTNFMSHAHTVIEPAAGLTVLVGANNVGKSAVVAALQILARNGSSTCVMRHGAKECSIRVETNDGQIVEWRRKTSPGYIINGQTFDRLKKGVPEELHRALRLPLVDACGDVHFGEQKAPIFLLGEPESVAARFFASSSDANRLVEIQRRHKDKHAEAKSKKRRLEEESRRVNCQLEVLAPVVDLDDRLCKIEDLHDEVLQLRSRLIEARADVANLASQAERLAKWQANSDVLARLPSLPSLFPVTQLAELIADLGIAQQEVEQTTLQVAVLSTIELPPSMQDVDTLKDLTSKLLKQANDVKRSTAIQQSLAFLTDPPTISPTEPLRLTVSKLERATAQQSVATARSDTLVRLAAPPELGDEADLQHRLIELITMERQVESWAAQSELLYTVASPLLPLETLSLETAVSQLEAAVRDEQSGITSLAFATQGLAEAARELRELAADSQCQLCGSQLDPDRVLANAAAGLRGHAHE